ncbi:Rrf2 family protein [Rubricella aquisinus]|uniref:Rrf2 family protein n=1 Tax=Rubricella aquisinus TaxID=2028108 RepID=A0A840WTE8_9RHOB|nr:Rrf2 family transcriptional regulator [Rubricella aquisinus]MBB5516952.1 Rrf2 family protein [Rubricella aquisinus]
MLRLSRKSILAIEAVLDVAYNARPEPVQARDITKRQGVPHRYLEQVLQRLVRDGVLKGVRGPRGGYTLARERRKVTVGDVVRVVAQMDVELDDTRSQGALFAEVVSPLWIDMQARIFAEMDDITMEHLCQQAEAANVPRAEVSDADDFTI